MSSIPSFPVVPLSDRDTFSISLRTYLQELPNPIDAFGGVFEEQLLNMFSSLLGLSCLNFKSRTNFFTEYKVTCPKPPPKEAICNKKFGPNDQGFMCLDCFPNKKAILCESCFDPEVHFKHQTSFLNHVNMTDLFCHCGDSEVRLSNLGCSKHTLMKNEPSKELKILPSKMCARLAPFVKTLFDFIIDVFRCSLRIQQEYSNDSFLKKKDKVIGSIWEHELEKRLAIK